MSNNTYKIRTNYGTELYPSSSYSLFVESASITNLTGTASYASSAGNASTIDINVFGSPVDSYLLMSNVAGLSGVAIGGDADLRYNSSTNVLTVGSISATSLTGSLQGTSSWASNSITASTADTFTVRGNLIVSGNTTIGDATTDSITMNAVTMSLGSGTGILNIDSNTFVVDGANNRVGILKSSPSTTLDISGSAIITGSLNITAGVTGSLLGTSSYATTADTASNVYATNVQAQGSAYAFVLTAAGSTGVKALGNTTAATVGVTPSVGRITATSVTASLFGTASFASTASYVNPLNQTTIITGSLNISGSITLASGSVTMPQRVAFSVYGSGVTNNLSTTQNGDGTLNSNNYAVNFYQGTGFNSGSGIFTAPIAGLYQVTFIGRNSGYSAGISQLAVIRNNSNANGDVAMIEWAASSTMNHTGGGKIFNLAVGDTLRLKVLAGQINFDGNDNWSVSYIG